MADTHVELIDPIEKLTGYVGPKQPASASALRADAVQAAAEWPALNMTVWKVLQTSVSWRRYAAVRRLRIEGRVVSCQVIGSVRNWWFVSVDATKAAEILGA